MRASLLALAASLALSPCAIMSPSAQAQAVTVGAVDRTGILPNGLRYFLHRIPDADRVELHLIVRAGNLHVPAGQPTQIAHVAEHSVIEDLSDQERLGTLSERLRAWGVDYGSGVNAATGDMLTQYSFSLSNDKAARFDDAFEILFGWASRGGVPAFDRDRAAVTNELSMGQAADGDSAIRRLVAGWDSPRLVTHAETMAGLARMTAQDVRAFIARWYRPNAEAVIIAGNFDIEEVEKRLSARFSALSGAAPDAIAVPTAVLDGSTRTEAISRPDLGERKLELFLKRPGAAGSAIERAHMAAVLKVLEAALSAKLAALVEEPSAALRTARLSTARDVIPGEGFANLWIGSGVRPDRWEDAARQIAQVLRAVRDEGFTDAEFARARASVARQRVTPADPVTKAVGRDVAQFLQQPEPVFDDAVDIASVEPEQVREAALRLLQDQNRILIAENPSNAPGGPPSPASIERAFRLGWSQPAQKRLTVSRGRTVTAEPLAPKAAAVLRETVSGQLTALHFANGPLVVLQPQERADGKISMLMMSRAGWRAGTSADQGAARLAVDAVTFGEISGLNQSERKRQDSASNLAVGPFLYPDRAGIRASAPTAELTGLLFRTRDVLAAGDPGQAWFDSWRELRLDERAMRDRTDDIFTDEVTSDTRGGGSSETEVLAKIGRKQLAEAYRRRFAVPQDFVIVLSGPFDVAQARALVGRFVASMPRQRTHLGSLAPVARAPWPAQSRRILHMGSSELASVSLRFRLPVSTPEMAQAYDVLANELDGRVYSRLREKEHGVYVSVAGISHFDDGDVLVIDFRTAPENVDRLIAAARDEVQKLVSATKRGEFHAQAGHALGDVPVDPWKLANRLLVNGKDLGLALAPLPPVTDAMLVSAAISIESAPLREFVLLPKRK